MKLDHALDVVRFGRPGKRRDGLAQRDVAVECCPEVGGLGEGVGPVGEASGDDLEEVVEGVDAFVLAGGGAAGGDGDAVADLGHERHPVDTGALLRELQVGAAVGAKLLDRSSIGRYGCLQKGP